MPTPVIVEVGSARVFASALDWPGWCRAARRRRQTPEPDAVQAALEELAAYRSRYAAVAELAGVPFRPARDFAVVSRVPGDATTDFGAPSVITEADSEPLTARQARRHVGLLRAAWSQLDRLAQEAPEQLRKGPRGGGRDRDAVVRHVVEAERSYARMIGVRHRPFDAADGDALAALRDDVASTLDGARTGAPLRPGGWPARYAVRRMAWHVLDHVWEIEDRS